MLESIICSIKSAVIQKPRCMILRRRTVVILFRGGQNFGLPDCIVLLRYECNFSHKSCLSIFHGRRRTSEKKHDKPSAKYFSKRLIETNKVKIFCFIHSIIDILVMFPFYRIFYTCILRYILREYNTRVFQLKCSTVATAPSPFLSSADCPGQMMHRVLFKRFLTILCHTHRQSLYFSIGIGIYDNDVFPANLVRSQAGIRLSLQKGICDVRCTNTIPDLVARYIFRI